MSHSHNIRESISKDILKYDPICPFGHASKLSHELEVAGKEKVLIRTGIVTAGTITWTGIVH